MTHLVNRDTCSSREVYDVGELYPHIVVPVNDPMDPYYIVEPGDEIQGANLDGVVNVRTDIGTGSGVLLSSGYHILTAAHVVDSVLDTSELRVNFDLETGRESYSVEQMHVHPNWSSNQGYDLALLKLSEPAPATGFDIYRESDEVGQPFHLVGYGRSGTGETGYDPDDPNLGSIKRWGMNTHDVTNGNVPINLNAPHESLLMYDFDDGTYENDLFGKEFGIHHTGLGPDEVMGTFGDSGGPAFLPNSDGILQVAGIVQGGSGNSSFGNTFGLNTRVSHYQDWIDSIADLDTEPMPSPEPEMNEVFTLFDSNSMTPDDLLNAMISDISGISLVAGSANYIGADNAASTFENFDFGGPVRMNQSGVLLTSGDGAPPLSNTDKTYTVVNDMPGDPQFDAIAQTAFGGAGSTNDASILEFSFNVDDPNVQTISFDLIFGSEEFPVYIDSSFVDIAAVLVNDVNYGLFDGNEERPLSVIGANIDDGNLLDNGTGYPSTSYLYDTVYDIEYNGISPRLTINVPLDGSDVYDVRIGVADTDDFSLDSGLFVSNFKTSTSSAGGLLVNVTADPEGGEMSPAGPNTATLFEGGSGDDTMLGSTAADIYNLSAGGSNTVKGGAAQLNGDTIQGFATNDKIQLQGNQITKDDLTVTMGSAILDIDTNGDGQKDTTITLEGDFENTEFLIEHADGDSLIFYTELDSSEPVELTNLERAGELITQFSNQVGLTIDNFDQDVIASRLLKELEAGRSLDDFDIIVSMDRVIRNDFREVLDQIGEHGITDALSSIHENLPGLFVPAETELFGL